MTKSALKTVLTVEYHKSEKKYTRLWDALIYLYKLGLVSESEHETMVEVNHSLSGTKD